jgi:hypothetical protein
VIVSRSSSAGSNNQIIGRWPNTRLREARLRTPSPANGRNAMSRQELAEAVNAHVFQATGRVSVMDAHYVGRLERGIRRYPTADYRAALRAVLGAATDAELGFLHPALELTLTSEAPCLPGGVSQIVVAPGMAVVVVPADHPVLLALLDGGQR